MERIEIDELKEELLELRQKNQEVADRINLIEEKLTKKQNHEKEGLASKLNMGKTSIIRERIIQKRSELSTAFKDKKESITNSDRNLEFRIGGTWLNRIGVIAVVLGLAYFLKYSFDNNWIGPTGRVLIGILAGLGMLVAGERLRLKYSGYAQGLLGGGSLALYFSIFAGYEFYNLISPPVAFLVLLVVMANTVFMAVRHNSLPIGILGIIGGFVIPFMVGSSSPSLWILVSYFTLLTGGVLGVSIYQKWTSFIYLSFLFNQLILAYIWFDLGLGWRRDISKFLIPVLSFMTAIFIFYLGAASIYNIRQQKKATKWDIGIIVLNAFLFFAWSSALLDKTFITDYIGFYATFLALIYIYLGKIAYGLFREDKGQIYSLFLVSFVLITIAVPLQLTGMYIGLAWLAEAIGLTYLSRKLAINKLIYVGLITLALGLVTTFEELDRMWRHETFLLNNPTLMLVGSLVAILIMIKLTDNKEQVTLFKLQIASVLKGVFLLVVFMGLTVQNNHYFQLAKTEFFLSPEQLSLSGLWLVYAVVLFVAGLKNRNHQLRYVSLGLLAIIIIKAFFIDLASLETMFKILLFIILGLSLLVISYFYQKKKDVIEGQGEGL